MNYNYLLLFVAAVVLQSSVLSITAQDATQCKALPCAYIQCTAGYVKVTPVDSNGCPLCPQCVKCVPPPCAAIACVNSTPTVLSNGCPGCPKCITSVS